MKPPSELTDEELRSAIEQFTNTEYETERNRKNHKKVDPMNQIRNECLKELASRQ
jgi:hypothetical protein